MIEMNWCTTCIISFHPYVNPGRTEYLSLFPHYILKNLIPKNLESQMVVE